MGDKARGWTARNLELYTVLLLNLLGAGKAGDLELKKKGVLVKPPWFSDKVDWKKFTSASQATADDNLDLVRGIFSFYNLDMKVHNNYPVVEEQLAAGEDNEQDEDQEEPGLLARLWLRMTLTWGRRRR